MCLIFVAFSFNVNYVIEFFLHFYCILRVKIFYNDMMHKRCFYIDMQVYFGIKVLEV